MTLSLSLSHTHTHTHAHIHIWNYANHIFGKTVGDVAGEIVGVAPGVEAHKIGDKVVSILGATVSALKSHIFVSKLAKRKETYRLDDRP